MAGAGLRMPTVTDFRRFGRFHMIQDLDIYHDLPSELLCHIFPGYIFEKGKMCKKFAEKLKIYCVCLRKQAEHEDLVQCLLDEKELLIRRVREKLIAEMAEKNGFCNVQSFEFK